MKTVVKVAMIALLWLIVVNSGTLAPDTSVRLKMAHALWTGEAEITLPSDYRPESRLGMIGILGTGGKRYYPYDLGQPLLMVPGDWVGTQLHKILPQFSSLLLRRLAVNFLIFIPLNILAVLSCYWLLKLFDFDEKIAGISSIIWLLTTTVLHYAQVNQQNNQILLCVTLSYVAALAFIKSGKSSLVFFSGLALGGAIIIRPTSLIHGLTVLLFLVGCSAYQKLDIVKLLKIAGLWCLGLLPFTLLWRFLDYLRFGSFWATIANMALKQMESDPLFVGLPPVPTNFPFSNPPYIGIWGVLFSPAKSIFIYDPLLLPCLGLTVLVWGKTSPFMQWYIVSAIFNLGFHIIFTSRLDFWHGDGAWAARYHVTSVHLLLIPLIGLLMQRWFIVKKLKRWLINGLLTLSLFVQIASVILYPSANSGMVNFAPPSSFLEFRLISRLNSIGCLINPAIFNDCPAPIAPSQENPLIEKINFWPLRFGKGQKPLWIIWGVVLIAAVVSTWKFWAISYQNFIHS